MSTVPSDSVAAPPPGAMSQDEVDRRLVDKIVVIGHSNLLYWWPVWAVCFLLAGLTYMDGHKMVVVPDGTKEVRGGDVAGFDGPRDLLVAPPGETFPLAPVETENASGQPVESGATSTASPAAMTVARSNSYGVIFAFTLFLVALVSTVTFRGLVSMIVIILMTLTVVTLVLLGVWDDIFDFLGGLDIRMNAAGYLFVGVPLFLVWAFVVFVYDRQRYMVVDEGQIRYVLDVGESEMVMPAEGAIVEKRRSDVFRHYVLGFGTGDLVIRIGGNSGQTIEIDNVVGIGRKLRIVNDKLRHKPVMVES